MPTEVASQVDERELLKRARVWDMQALEQIYDLYSPQIYRYAMRLLGNADLAEECVAETFSRFLHALRRGRGPKDHLKAYLFRIAHNWITDLHRRSRPVEGLEEYVHLIVDSDPGPDESAHERWQQEQIRALLFQLTPEQRQVLVLRFLEGWSHQEIAQALGKPVSAVKALQRRGLAALRRLLDRKEEGTYAPT